MKDKEILKKISKKQKLYKIKYKRTLKFDVKKLEKFRLKQNIDKCKSVKINPFTVKENRNRYKISEKALLNQKLRDKRKVDFNNKESYVFTKQRKLENYHNKKDTNIRVIGKKKKKSLILEWDFNNPCNK